MNKRRALSVCLALVVCSVVAAPAVAADEPTESYVIVVDESGDADVTLTLSFDLDDDDERDAFEQLRDDTEATDDFRGRFADRFASVAADAEEETEREMSISGASIDLETVDEVGIIELSVQWHGLAAVEDDSMTITEPFANGFTSDRQFVVVGPAGHEVDTATPEPDEQDGPAASWAAGNDLDGFEVTFVESDTAEENEDASHAETDEEESAVEDEASGVGAIVALAALVSSALLLSGRAK